MGQVIVPMTNCGVCKNKMTVGEDAVDEFPDHLESNCKPCKNKPYHSVEGAIMRLQRKNADADRWCPHRSGVADRCLRLIEHPMRKKDKVVSLKQRYLNQDNKYTSIFGW